MKTKHQIFDQRISTAHSQPQRKLSTHNRSNTDEMNTSSTSINKRKILQRIENQYKKVDPGFNIKHYISENEDLIEKRRQKMFKASAQKSLMEALRETIQKQIKTPLNFRNKYLKQTMFIQTEYNDNSRQRWIAKKNQTEIDENTTQTLDFKSEQQVNLVSRNRDNRRKKQETSPKPLEETTISAFELTDAQKLIIKKQKSPLVFLFWKYRTLVEQSYNESSLQMKNLIDLYSPTKSLKIQQNSPVFDNSHNHSRKKRKSSRLLSGTLDEAYFKRRSQTQFQKQKMLQIKTELLSTLVSVEESVKRVMRKVDKKMKKNQFQNLKKILEEKIHSYRKDLMEQITVTDYLKDRQFLKELIGLMQKENPKDDYSAYQFLMDESPDPYIIWQKEKLKEIQENCKQVNV